jgi:hypothetical protein
MISRSDAQAVAETLLQLMTEETERRREVIKTSLRASLLLRERGPLATAREARAIRELVVKPRDTDTMEAGVLRVARAALVDVLERRGRSFN